MRNIFTIIALVVVARGIYMVPWMVPAFFGFLILIFPLFRRFGSEDMPQFEEKFPKWMRGVFHIRTSILCTVGALMCVFFFSLQAVISDNADKEEQKVAAEKQAQEEQKTAEHDAQVKDKNEKEARSMGLSYDEYVEAKKKETYAHIACQAAVIASANWSGAGQNWTSDYSWSARDGVITIVGHDISMKNGFGAERDVTYQCKYDIAADDAVPISVE